MYKVNWYSKHWETGSGWTNGGYIDDNDMPNVETVPAIEDDMYWLYHFYEEHYSEAELAALADDSNSDDLNQIEYYEIKLDEDGDEYTDNEPTTTNDIWASEIAKEVLSEFYGYTFPEDK